MRPFTIEYILQVVQVVSLGMRLCTPQERKVGQPEEECVTPIEACSLVEIIELY